MTENGDDALLAILKRNAREPVASIARKLNLSRSTVQDRLKRLEERGKIRGYTVLLGQASDAGQVCAFVTVMVDPKKTATIVGELGAILAVDAIYTVSGKFDIMVEISSANTAEIDTVIDRISAIPGVNKTETSIVLSTKFRR